MKKDRDWIDYANLAANVASAAQLHSIDQAIAEQSNREEMARLEDEREAKLREIVFQTENMIGRLKNEIAEGPVATYAVALEIKNTFFGDDNITTANFHAYEDKDRLKQVLNALEEVSEKSAAGLTPAEKEDAEKCAKYRTEMPRLEIVISLQKEQDAYTDKIKELDQIKATEKNLQASSKPSRGIFTRFLVLIVFMLKGGKVSPLMGGLMLICIILLPVLVGLFFAVFDLPFRSFSDATVFCAILIFVIVFFAISALIRFIWKRKAKETPKLFEPIKALIELERRKITLEAEIQALKDPAMLNLGQLFKYYDLFGADNRLDLSSKYFIQLREKRQSHIKKVFADV